MTEEEITDATLTEEVNEDKDNEEDLDLARELADDDVVTTNNIPEVGMPEQD